MKKVFELMLSMILVFASVGAVFANEITEEDDISVKKIEVLKEFTEEFHKINELRVDILALRQEVVQKNDTIIELIIQAHDEGDNEALDEAKEIKKEIRKINQEINDTYKTIKEERRAFKAKAKEGDFEAAKGHIEKVIEHKETVKDKFGEKIELQNKIVDIFE